MKVMSSYRRVGPRVGYGYTDVHNYILIPLAYIPNKSSLYLN